MSKGLAATVVNAGDLAEAREKLAGDSFHLVLVNRVLADTGDSGIDVVRELLRDNPKTAIMLVSDREDAQAEAIALGAVPGFGKADLSNPATIDLIAKAASLDK